MLPEIEQFHKWLRRKAPHSATALHYTGDVTLFFTWSGKPPGEISFRDVDAFIDACQQRGHANATVNRRLAALRTFYKFLALERDDAPPNPVIPRRHYIRRGRHLPRDVQDADLAQLFAVIHAPRDRAMFQLMLDCGLRVGEVQSLSMNDLHLEPSAAALPRLYVHGKGSYERVVYITGHALVAVHRWLHARPRTPSDAVFLNRFGGRFTVTGIQLCLGAYCHRAGLWITCHQLRHTYVRHMNEAGLPLTTLQLLLGHERLRSTQIYLHVTNEKVQHDYDKAIAAVAQRLTLPGGEA